MSRNRCLLWDQQIVREHYLSYYHRMSGIQVVSLPYANVYPDLARILKAKRASWPFHSENAAREQAVVNGNGRQTRDFVFVEDVVETNLMAMGPQVEGVLQCGTGIETSVNDLFRIVVDLTKVEFKEVHGAKRGEQARSVIDCANSSGHSDGSRRLTCEKACDERWNFSRWTQVASRAGVVPRHGRIYLDDQASIPPIRFFTFPNPCCRRNPVASALLIPWWQTAIISELRSSLPGTVGALPVVPGQNPSNSAMVRIPGLTNIHEHQFVTFIQPRLYFCGCNSKAHQHTSPLD